ncbi:hypothetical protein [Tengunoibacter tsumagoiensis]|uniref:hypothetical protein n=1 Tax=Tengunoibacter tsumagoiensis TaxID=2014871 RepID=UPI000F832179|nr:hypothetical protein [Tengunoibacter tsumagoiensis]
MKKIFVAIFMVLIALLAISPGVQAAPARTTTALKVQTVGTSGIRSSSVSGYYSYSSYDYTQQGDSYWYADEQAISGSLVVSSSGSIQSSHAESQSETWSADLTLGGQQDITASVGFQWNHSATDTTIYTIFGTPGRTAQMMFRPKMHQTWGSMHQTDWYYDPGAADNGQNGWTGVDSYYNASGATPVTFSNGQLDGERYLAYAGNLVSNASFEGDLYSWGDYHPGGQASAQKVDSDWPFDGGKKLTHWLGSKYIQDTYQIINDVPPGTYFAKVWVRSSGGQNHLQLYVDQFDNSNQGRRITTDLGGQAVSGWNYITIDNIKVTNTTVSLNLYSDAGAGQWAAFDQVTFQRYGQI